MAQTRQGYTIGAQAAIEITTDEYGDLILRQGTSTITVSANNIRLLIDLLIDIDNDPEDNGESASLDYGRLIKDIYGTTGSGVAFDPEDMDDAPLTNAERQQRYREKKKRNGTVTNVTENVTDVTQKRNGVTDTDPDSEAAK